MTTQIEAIYHNGVFEPVGAVNLPENQRVHLQIRPVEPQEVLAWLEHVKRNHQKFIEQHGYLPDSTPEIAADRMRDE